MRLTNQMRTSLFVFLALACIYVPRTAKAVTSKVVRHSKASDFLKGKTENIIIDSKGTLKLGLADEKLTEDFNDTWSINSIVLSGGKIYIGTSPNGGIYQYSLGTVKQLYSAGAARQVNTEKPEISEPNDANETQSSPTDRDEHLANEHIFAMATDISGRLLAGISGRRCALCRFESGELVTIYEPNDAKYIFAIAIADDGRIYLGTGPQGKIYALDSAGLNPEVIYDSPDKNILSLAIANDGSLLAGSDTRGLVYKIDLDSGKAKVLYDSEQQEITALLVTENGDIYASATSAGVVKTQDKFAKQFPLAGKPEDKSSSDKDSKAAGSSLNLKIANTKQNSKSKTSQGLPSGRKASKTGGISHIYKISADGFVTDVFAEPAVLFALNRQGDELLLGTGNEAELFTIEPAKEKSAVVYKDRQASQITAIAVSQDDVYLGTANPAKLIKLKKSFTNEGQYTSDLIDASQPADWGKLQIEADIPADCKVAVSSRSGNVKDFSDWTEPAEVTGPVQLLCPLGRFCQYKIILSSSDGLTSPLIREVAVANTIPNLAPKVKAVIIERIDNPDKKGFYEIKYEAQDDNSDTLIYTIDFRKSGRDSWIQSAEKVEKPSYQWDGKTVEDGQYEIRVTANDKRSNSPATALTGSRVSEPVVVDNTGPVIEIHSIADNQQANLIEPAQITGTEAVIKLSVIDILSAVGQLDYTIDSNTDFKAAVPNDLVYDTTKEEFTIELKDLKDGEHVIAFRAKDDLSNTTYKSVKIEVKNK